MYFLNLSRGVKKLPSFINRSWKVGQWTDCSKTCNAGRPGTRSREVVCSVTSAGIETEVGDGACAELKPNTREECALEACPANWVTVGLGRVSMGPSGNTYLIGLRRHDIIT